MEESAVMPYHLKITEIIYEIIDMDILQACFPLSYGHLCQKIHEFASKNIISEIKVVLINRCYALKQLLSLDLLISGA